jgi:hypothetical protein
MPQIKAPQIKAPPIETRWTKAQPCPRRRIFWEG